MTGITDRGGIARRALIGSLSVSLTLTLAGCIDGSDQSLGPTAKVERATVSASVTAQGSLAALSSQGLGFPKGGQLKKVMVKVGDHVDAGQVLAQLDDFPFQQQLNQQRALLSQQRAQLDLLRNGQAVPGAQAALSQARKILDATKRNVDVQQKADRSATDRARTQLDVDQRLRDQANRAYSQCLANPPVTTTPTTTLPTGSTASGGSATSGGTSSPAGAGSPAGTAATGGTTEPSSGTIGSGGTITPTATSGETARQRWGRHGPGSAYGGAPPVTALPAATGSAACTGQQQAVNSAGQQVVAGQTAVEAARQKENTDASQGQLSIRNAQQSVVSAQSTLNSAATDRPSAIQAQASLVSAQQALVALAQRDVQDAVLRAPIAGTISVINGAVGEFVGPASGTTALAPGSAAALPSGSAAATTSDVGARPINGVFMELNDVDAFQVVVPFAEADAVQMAVNRPATVTFDAIPGLSRDGTVVAVAPTPTTVDGENSYYATVLLTDSDPRLRDGLLASAAVVANSVDNVLSVPKSAVVRRGSQTLVTTAGPDGTSRQIPFQAGLVGDDRTEVVSGLSEGQVVMAPIAPRLPPPAPAPAPGSRIGTALPALQPGG